MGEMPEPFIVYPVHPTARRQINEQAEDQAGFRPRS